MEPDTPIPATPRYAGFWVRVGAALIDTLVLGLVLSLIGRVLGLSSPGIELNGTDLGSLTATLMSRSWTLELLLAALVIACWLTKRGTPGKLILGLEVVDADTLGTLQAGQSVGRYLGYFLSAIPFCLGLLWVGLDKRKQGWHDKLAGTLVIHKHAKP